MLHQLKNNKKINKNKKTESQKRTRAYRTCPKRGSGGGGCNTGNSRLPMI
jgi:hypothetical protein